MRTAIDELVCRRRARRRRDRGGRSVGGRPRGALVRIRTIAKGFKSKNVKRTCAALIDLIHVESDRAVGQLMARRVGLEGAGVIILLK